MKTHITTIASPYWELSLREGERSGPVQLRAVQQDVIYADYPYLYAATIGDSDEEFVEDTPHRTALGFAAELIVRETTENVEAVLTGQLIFEAEHQDEIHLTHRFVLSKTAPTLDEYITLTKVGRGPSHLRALQFVFQKYVGEQENGMRSF